MCACVSQYVCIYIYMCVSCVPQYVCMYVYVCVSYVHVYLSMYVCMYIPLCGSFRQNLTHVVGYRGGLWVINILTHKPPVFWKQNKVANNINQIYF